MTKPAPTKCPCTEACRSHTRNEGIPEVRASWYAQAPGGMVEKPLYCYLRLLYQSESVFHVSMHRIPAREGMISRMTTNSRLPLST